MKKKTLFLTLIVCLLFSLITSVAFADPDYVDSIVKDSHKIRNKWDLSGTYIAHLGYNWGGMAEGASWTFNLHIKEAMDGRVSKGTIHFYTMVDGTEIDVVGHVKETKRDYMWADIAAVGTADFNGTTYYFMFFYADYATWLALSNQSYEAAWAADTTISPRLYQTHSLNPGTTLPLYWKAIHE